MNSQPSSITPPLVHQPPRRPGPGPARAGAQGRGGRRPWERTWVVALVLLAFLSFRIPEYFLMFRYFKPVVTATVISIFLLATRIPSRRWEWVSRQWPMRFLLTYAALATFGVAFAFVKSESLRSVVNTFPFAIVLLAAMLLIEPTIERLNRMTVGFVATVSLVGVMCFLTGRVDGDRLGSGASYDPNDLGAMMSLTVPLALGLITSSKRFLYRVVGLVGVAICLVVIAKSASRGGTIALGMAMAVYILAQRPARLVLALIMSVIMAAGLWQFGPETFRERTRSIMSLDEDYNTQSDNGRIAIWKRGLVLVQENPVLGVGVGNFANADGAKALAAGRIIHWFTAHNTYLQAAAEIGIPGCIVLLCLLGRAISDTLPLYWRRSRKRAPGVPQRPEYLTSVISFCTSGIFLSHAVHPLLFGVISMSAFAGLVARSQVAAGMPQALPARRRGPFRGPVRAAPVPRMANQLAPRGLRPS